jgi:hypothetical protein
MPHQQYDPTQAEIVYTPVNVFVQNNTYNLDLNNDGVTDFTINGVNKDGFCAVPPYYQQYPHDTATIKVLPASGNGVEGGSRAAALDAAAVIGPGQTFYFTGSLMEHVKIGRYLFDYCIPGICIPNCALYDVENGRWFDFTGYLGLEFQISSETHYGWAAVSVQFDNSQVPWTLSATITGYAYETIPGQSIVAGQTSGTEGNLTPARGSAGSHAQ